MKPNTAGQVVGAQMVSATDGSAFTGAVTVAVTVDGGTQATGSVGSGACTHEGNGFHTYAPAQAETNGDHIAFTFTGTGAIPVTLQVYTGFPQTGDAFARLGAPAGASVSADIATVDGNVDAILLDTAEIGAAGAGLTNVPWNASWDAEVQSEVNDGLVALGLDNLVSKAAVGAEIADNSVIAKIVSSAATADWDTFVNTTDALEALRDRGDAAWVTGGGGSISDIVHWEFDIPGAIDLANTATYRVAIHVTNALDDLPTALEITPGTVEISRKAQGGTTWANPTGYSVAQAMSEDAGLIYLDFVASTANGFASGDMLRFVFKGQTVTVSANDYEICDGTVGVFKYSGIVADTPDVNIAQINGSATNVAKMNLFFSLLNGSGQVQSGTVADAALSAPKFADGFLTAAKASAGYVTAIQSGLATAAEAAAIQTVVDAIKVVTDALPEGGALTTLLSNVAAILEDTVVIGTPVGASVVADIAALQTAIDAQNDLSAAEVNAEVVDALSTDTYAEPASVPAATASIAAKIGFLMALARNKTTQTATTKTLRNDADAADIGTSAVSDNGTTFTKGEWS